MSQSDNIRTDGHSFFYYYKYMYFNYVELPADFCNLLKSNMQTTGEGYQILRKKLWDRPHFQAIVARACYDLKGPHTFERIINSLGWLGLRDRLASTYLYHQEHGHFPDRVLLKNIEDILLFEEQLKGQTIDGHGRHFLYAFYTKMNLYYIKRTDPKGTYHSHLISKDSLAIIKGFTKKAVEVDWLCLSIHHLCELLGPQKVRDVLSQGGSYMELFSLLSDSQRYTMNENFLTYATSIKDENPYTFSQV